MKYSTFEQLITADPFSLEEDDLEYLNWVEKQIENIKGALELGQDEEYYGLDDWERNK